MEGPQRRCNIQYLLPGQLRQLEGPLQGVFLQYPEYNSPRVHKGDYGARQQREALSSRYQDAGESNQDDRPLG